MLTIYIDADACPVKDEVYRVARRYAMPMKVVANAPLRVPADARIELMVRPGYGPMTGSPNGSGRARSSSRPTSRWRRGAWRARRGCSARDLLADLRQGGEAPAGLGGPAR
jgi:hypothetical protein